MPRNFNPGAGVCTLRNIFASGRYRFQVLTFGDFKDGIFTFLNYFYALDVQTIFINGNVIIHYL